MNKSQGFVHLIVLIIVVVLILSYFRIDIRGFIESDLVQKNIGYVLEILGRLWAFLFGLWQTYISPLF